MLTLFPKFTRYAQMCRHHTRWWLTQMKLGRVLEVSREGKARSGRRSPVDRVPSSPHSLERVEGDVQIANSCSVHGDRYQPYPMGYSHAYTKLTSAIVICTLTADAGSVQAFKVMMCSLYKLGFLERDRTLLLSNWLDLSTLLKSFGKFPFNM
jgi:hypothetical protein